MKEPVYDMKRQPLLSVVIPAYNAENTLAACIGSLEDSTCNRYIEILVVENGSTDNTDSIIESLCNKYDNVKGFHSPKGVSNARNAGIEKAAGQWILFVDADDEIIKGKLSVIVRYAQDSASDLVLFGHEKAGQILLISDTDKIWSGEEAVASARELMMERPTKYMPVWGKLFKRNLITDHDLRFDPELTMAEDSEFLIRYTHYCKAIEFSKEAVYQYNLYGDSAVRTFNYENVQAYTRSMKASAAFVRQESSRMKEAFYKYVAVHMTLILVRTVFCMQNKDSLSRKLSVEKRISRIPVFARAVRHISLRDCKWNPALLPAYFIKGGHFHAAAFVCRVRAYSNHKKENP